MRIEARGKINWTLDILGRRPDGYHLMDMLLQSVSLADTICLEPGEGLTLSAPGCPWLPTGPENLMMQAAAAMQKAAGTRRGIAMTLVKRLPAGAGMGGGSADAAAVIAGLNRLWSLGMTQAEMEALGVSLGADVPFCLRGGLCRVRGIGEELESLPCEKLYWLVVAQPCRSLSTRKVFEAFAGRPPQAQTRPRTEAARQALAQGDIPALIRSLGNVLQPVSQGFRPEIGRAVEALTSQGALAALMTGSGSAVFGMFASAREARRALAGLSAWRVRHMMHTCREGLIFTEG